MLPRRLVVVAVAAVSCALTLPALARTSQPTPVRTSVSTRVDAATLSDAYAASPGPVTPRVSALQRCGSVGTGSPAGEGIVRLTAAAPGTSWASGTDTSLVVDIRVDAGPAQQVVLFGGAQPYAYTGFTGPLALGPHCVTVTLRPDLSHTTSRPLLQLYAVSLGVVPLDDPAYLAVSHAPVLYGRSTSAQGDTPLITYGQQAADSAGGQDLTYVVTWTHEDVGTGLVPADEWGRYGRMTDIETVLHEHVATDGRVLSATYLSCGCESLPAYPDLAPELPPSGETNQPFTGQYDGQHAVLRDATGNNDISPAGTTGFRFQQALVAPPGVGQSREVAMDAHPWTYQLSNDEVAREDAAYSTSARSLLPGDYRQYLIVDIDAATPGTDSVAIEVQLPGDPTWYTDDYAQTTAGVPSTYPFYDGGHRRTVVKLPTGWLRHGISALRLRYNVPPGASQTPTVTVRSLQLLALTDDWRLVSVTPQRTLPPVTATALIQAPVA